MASEFASEQDLFERLADHPDDVVFLVGSAVTAPERPGDPGVPRVDGVIDMIREEYRRPEQTERLEAKLAAAEQGNRYQTAFEHLARTRGQDAMNQIVRRCVLRAWSRPVAPDQALTPDFCRRIEDEHDGWHLPAGVRALGQILATGPAGARPVVLTSNFDPLIAVSVRRHGGSTFTAALQSDGSFSGIDGQGCMVVHFHGDWFRTDTLHTPTHLGRERPQLGASMAQLISQRTLVVLGYSGWDDAFSRSLAALIAGELAPISVAWTFRGDDEDRLRTTHARLLDRLAKGQERGRVILYKGVDVHRFLPRLADELRRLRGIPEPEPAPAPAAPPPPLRTLALQPLLIDPADALAAQPPGSGFDPAWYIPRGREKQAVQNLAHHGGVLVSGAPMGGKSTFIQAVLAQFRVQRPNHVCVIGLGLGDLSASALQDSGQCFRELAGLAAEKYAKEMREQFGEAVDVEPEPPVTASRRGRRSEERNLWLPFRNLMRTLVGRARVAGHTLVLVLDRFERIIGQKTVGQEVARALRALRDESNQEGYPLSLLLGASGTNLHFAGVDAVSELANVCDPIHLGGFGLADLARLAGLYQLRWTDPELADLHALLGGHPYLTRFMFFLEASGVARAELLANARYNFRHVGPKLRELWVTVEAQPELRDAIRALLVDRGPLSHDQRDRLRVSGVLDDAADPPRIAGTMIEAYFRGRC